MMEVIAALHHELEMTFTIISIIGSLVAIWFAVKAIRVLLEIQKDRS